MRHTACREGNCDKAYVWVFCKWPWVSRFTSLCTAVTQGCRIGGDVPQGRLWVESRPRRLRPCGPVRSCGPVPFTVTVRGFQLSASPSCRVCLKPDSKTVQMTAQLKMWKLSLTRNPDPIRPMKRSPDPVRLTRRGPDSNRLTVRHFWKLAMMPWWIFAACVIVLVHSHAVTYMLASGN